MDKIGEKKIDFFDIFKKFLDDEEHRVLTNLKKTLSVCNVESDGREIYGVFKSGEYDISADFLDVKNGNLKENARKLNDSEVYPYFFLIKLPKNFEKGILILQSFSIHAIKTVLENAINSFFEDAYDSYIKVHGKPKTKDEELEKLNELKNYVVDIKPLVSEKLLERLKESEGVYEIKLIRNKLPKNSAKRLWNAKKGLKQMIGDPENIKQVITYSVKNKKSGFLDKGNIVDALSNVKTTYAEIFEEHYDEISIVVDIDGSEHSIFFGSKNRYNEVLPLDEEKIVIENGFPEYTYIKQTAKGYLKYLNQ